MSRSITPEPTPPQTITVSSAAGFNAGDLVYFNGSTGDYGTPTPSAAGATVSVPATTAVPLLGGLTGANALDVGIYGGCSSKNFAAILTNGNIVQVYFNAANNQPTFRIVDTTNTVVVAGTSISATFLNSGVPNIAVVALTGGGFAVAWINTSGGTAGRPCYAVYTNAGVVTAAASQDTGGSGTGSVGYVIKIKATPSGGFIISYYAPSTVVNARGYAANGTAAFAWVSLASTNASTQTGLAVRSDGSFLLTASNSGSTIAYAIWSSVGVALVGSTTFTSTNGTALTAVDAECLSNGTTFVIAYAATIGTNTIAFRFLPTGDVLGAEFYIPIANTKGSAGIYRYLQDIAVLSGNRFVIASSMQWQQYSLYYAVFDSTGACLSGTSGTTSTAAVPIAIPQAWTNWSQAHISVLESPAGYLTFYYPSTENTSYSMQYSTVDATTYAPINITPTNQVAGSASSTPVMYAPSGSNPLGAAFSIAPGSYAVSGTFGTIIKNPEIVDTASVNNIATTTLPNGQVLVAYIIAATGEVKVAVYSIAGVLTQTLSIGTDALSFNIQAFSKVSISALTSGKFVIAYANTTNNGYIVKLYSSAFTQIGSTYTVSCPGGTTSEYGASVSGLTGDRYIVVYSGTSNFANYQVYDNTNTQLVGATVINAVDMKQLTVCGYSSGGFFVSGRITSNNVQFAQYSNPSGNTFTQIVAFTNVSSTSIASSPRPSANTNSTVCMAYPESGSSIRCNFSTVGTNNNSGGPNFANASTVTLDGSAIGFSGSGVAVATAQASGVMQLFNAADGQVALSATLVKPYVAAASSQNSMTPSYGNNVGIAYIDINSKVNYMIVCGNSLPTKTILTSTDPSTAINIYPGATSATPAIQNTVFTGVALQTVPAGGAGLVQVSGTAQLGSTYPAGTTYRAFDHQSQGVPGVKGTITGRAITLQGT